MTTEVMERKVEHASGAPTVAFLYGQLESLANLLATTTEASAHEEIERIRTQTRNHLSAMLLSEDETFCASLNEFLRRLANGVAPTGLVGAEQIDELLGL